MLRAKDTWPPSTPQPIRRLVSEAIGAARTEEQTADTARRAYIAEALGIQASDLESVDGEVYRYGSALEIKRPQVIVEGALPDVHVRVKSHYLCMTNQVWSPGIASRAALGRWILSLTCPGCLEQLGLTLAEEAAQ